MNASTRETGWITGTKDKDYNLIWFGEQCLSNVLRLETYALDAEREGDTELMEFFRRAQGESARGPNRPRSICASGSPERPGRRAEASTHPGARPPGAVLQRCHAVTATIRCASCGKPNRVRPTPSGVPQCGNCHQPLPWIVDAEEQSFDEELSASVPVLVDFWAPWCGPCRMVSPLVERLGLDRAGHIKIVKLNVDSAPGAASRHGIQGIPVLMLMRDGRELDRLVGAAPEPQLRAWIDARLAEA